MTEPKEGPAADTAVELMKQLITLSSGVLALSATFIEKFPLLAWWHVLILAASWCSLVLSVLMGLEAISAIVKTRLQPAANDWSKDWERTKASISKYSFVVGISLFAAFAFISLFTNPTPTPDVKQKQAIGMKHNNPEPSVAKNNLPDLSL